MAEKTIETRGRKPIPENEKKHKILVFVKAKNYAKAKAAIERIARTYNSK